MSEITHVEIAQSIISNLKEAAGPAREQIGSRLGSFYCGEEERVILDQHYRQITAAGLHAQGFEPCEVDGKVFESSHEMPGCSDCYYIYGTRYGHPAKLIINFRQFNIAVWLLPEEMRLEIQKHFRGYYFGRVA